MKRIIIARRSIERLKLANAEQHLWSKPLTKMIERFRRIGRRFTIRNSDLQ
jgi:hypothetical protein